MTEYNTYIAGTGYIQALLPVPASIQAVTFLGEGIREAMGTHTLRVPATFEQSCCERQVSIPAVAHDAMKDIPVHILRVLAMVQKSCRFRLSIDFPPNHTLERSSVRRTHLKAVLFLLKMPLVTFSNGVPFLSALIVCGRFNNSNTHRHMKITLSRAVKGGKHSISNQRTRSRLHPGIAETASPPARCQSKRHKAAEHHVKPPGTRQMVRNHENPSNGTRPYNEPAKSHHASSRAVTQQTTRNRQSA